ncbi:gonadal somatic cell derived factor isoform X2 [Hoplias malabaricus]|uniref:gonadal somatic cell derived factor isoform X2 n=1 Tax=Hoplias malabaricus TaxID=27720 RepID=UPI003462D848
MSLVLLVFIMLVGCHLGKAFVLQPEEPEETSAVSSSRCQAESLQSVRRIILDALNLQNEPRVSVPGLALIREQWKIAFRGTGHSEPTLTKGTGNQMSSGISNLGNSTVLQCCKLASQIFIKDLGWDQWIIYPESFTFVHCHGCDPQQGQSVVRCKGDSSPSSQAPCCEPVAHNLVPFLYLDETSSLVMSSVALTRECGCGPGNGPQALKP